MAVGSRDKKKLGKLIKQLRESKIPMLSQRKLALAVDITNASLSAIENGSTFPSEEVFLQLMHVLQPPEKKAEELLSLFAEAKGTAPPDINAYLRSDETLHDLLRCLMKKQITTDAVQYMMEQAQKLEDKPNEQPDQY